MDLLMLLTVGCFVLGFVTLQVEGQYAWNRWNRGRRQSTRPSVTFPDDREKDEFFSGREDHTCPINNNKRDKGVCRPLSRCATIRVDTIGRTRPFYCQYNRNDPIVCCPEEDVRGSDVGSFRPAYARPPPPRIGTTTTPSPLTNGDCGISDPVNDLSLIFRSTRTGRDIAYNDYHNRWRRQETVNLQPQVVGGKVTDVAKWPWMTAVGYVEGGKTDWLCGGTLISNQYVVTAAHCTVTKKPRFVRLGEYDLETDGDGAQPIDIEIESVLRHPDFKYPELYNDIALLKLKKKVTSSRYIRPICLPPANAGSLDYSTVTITGWGHTQFGGKPSTKLQEVDLQVMPLSQCKAVYSDTPETTLNFPKGIRDTQLCASVSGGGKDACQGDSGGPLVMYNANRKRYVLVGIVSGGIGCGIPDFPGIYTRVTSYLTWIQKNI